MALFPGEELIDVQTPDGRAMKLPRSIASAFPGLAAPAPVTTPAIAPPAPDPVVREAGAVPATLSAPVVTTPAVDAVSAADPATPPREPAEPKPPQETPPPAPTTPSDLRGAGFGGVIDRQNAALDAQAAAGKDKATVEADQWTRIANMQAEQEKKVDEILTARAKAAEENARRVEQATSSADAAVKAYADHKVDRNVSHPIVAALSVALGAIGSAMKNESKNPALDMLMSQIDKNVQLQLADREKLRDVAGQRRSAIDAIRQQASDRTAQYNLALAGEIERTKRLGDQIMSRSNSQLAKANWAEYRAKLDEKKAEVFAAGVNQQVAKDERDRAYKEQLRSTRVAEGQRAAGIALDRQRFAQSQYEFDERLKREDAKILLEAKQLDAAGKAAEAKALREEHEKNRELGVGAPPRVAKDASGKAVVDETGTPVIERGAPLRNADGELFRAADKDSARDLRKKMAAAGEITSIIDEVLAIRDRVGGESETFNSDESQRLGVLQNQLIKISKSGTEGMSSDADMKKLADALGAGDVRSFRSLAAGLEEGRLRTETLFNRELQANQYTGKPVKFAKQSELAPTRPEEQEAFKKAMGWQTNPYAYGKTEEVARAYPMGRARGASGIAADVRGYSDEQKQLMDAWASVVANPEADSQKQTTARTQLRLVRDRADSPGMRAYAKAKLDEIDGVKQTEQKGAGGVFPLFK